jgi:hypothetical protein
MALEPTPKGVDHDTGGSNDENDENLLKNILLPTERAIRGEKLTVSFKPESPRQRWLLKETELSSGSAIDGYDPPVEVEVMAPR